MNDDRENNLENGFPVSGKMVVEEQGISYSMYVFKSGKKANYAPKEGIVFIVNGQHHGAIPKRFFDTQRIKLSYLKDSILIIVDCSDIKRSLQEKVFMSSRDRMRQDTSFYKKMEADITRRF